MKEPLCVGFVIGKDALAELLAYRLGEEFEVRKVDKLGRLDAAVIRVNVEKLRGGMQS